MSSGSDDDRDAANLTPNGDADQELIDEMDDLFDEDVDDEAGANAYVLGRTCAILKTNSYHAANDGRSTTRS
jgi:hypothetical protein